jgi:hypothetical protein
MYLVVLYVGENVFLRGCVGVCRVGVYTKSKSSALSPIE